MKTKAELDHAILLRRLHQLANRDKHTPQQREELAWLRTAEFNARPAPLRPGAHSGGGRQHGG